MAPGQRESRAEDAGSPAGLLEIEDLSVRYQRGPTTLQAVSGVSVVADRGEVLGIVGESGSGKSTLARAILRLLPRTAEITGEVRVAGRDLIGCSKRELRRLRWSEVSMVFQDAMNALNPVLRIGDQLVETIRLHESVSKADAVRRARELVEMVSLDDRTLRRYPHELSGGMRQRVCIAMAFACNPRVVLADEPTTALDVITQDRVIAEMLELQARHQQTMVFISHDIALVSEVSDKVGVMYAGHLVEFGRVGEVLFEPGHPYTMGLLNAFPRADVDRDVVSIPGDPARFATIPDHCPFVARCPFAQPVCSERPPDARSVGAGHWAACHFADDAADLRARAQDPQTWRPAAAAPEPEVAA
ncbi:MAG TPA: ABC transporter ATP-binding protein [Solirubrobacteraceae bacterium]|jgi:oligopeptide/dipeptide ABC transporter ATP-binding protein|nr:ABC transporter ATP-binding protein [Solirubrobacteraceae bacterium]